MYDVYAKYKDEPVEPQLISEDTKEVTRCTSCGWNHKDVSFLVDPYDGKYFVCQCTEQKVFYK